jgi:large subunit ribosomal protein L5
MTPRYKNMYQKEILPKLMAKLNYKNKHQTPVVIKVVLNVGLGEDATDAKKVKSCQDDITAISGQKAIVTKFRKSIANFKTRKGFSAGVKVTLR